MKLPKGVVAALCWAVLELLLPTVSASSLRGLGLDEVPPVDEVTVLKQEIVDLHKHEASLQADKDQLISSLRGMMESNASAKLEKQVKDITELKVAEEARFNHDRGVLDSRLKEAESKGSDAKEVMHSLQEQNLELEHEVKELRVKVAGLEKNHNNIQTDKEGLIVALRDSMSENSKLKQDLAKSGAMLKEARARVQNLIHRLPTGTNSSAKQRTSLQHTRKLAKKQGRKAKHPHRKNMTKEEIMSDKLSNDPTASMTATKDIDQYLNRVYRNEVVDQWVTSLPDFGEYELERKTEGPAVVEQQLGGKLTQWLGMRPQAVQQAAQEVAQQAMPRPLVAVVPARHPPTDRARVSTKPVSHADPAKSEVHSDLSPIDVLIPPAAAQEKKKHANKNSEDASDDVTKLLNEADAELDAATRE